MPADITWNLNGCKRWEITAELESVTSLHIGSGESTARSEIKNKKGEPAEINSFIKGQQLPMIPGSTIKGRLYQWLKKNGIDRSTLEAIFGKGHDQETEDQGRGGQAEFHDAQISHKLSGEQPYPYWQEETQTYIAISTAINRHTKTALQRSLHRIEMVPPRVRFELRITGVMKDKLVNVLLAALETSRDPDKAICFGAGDADGNGRMSLYGDIEAKYMDEAAISSWLNSIPKKQKTMAMSSRACKKLTREEIKQSTVADRQTFRQSLQDLKLEVRLQFAGPFIINDPSKEDESDRDQPGKSPLTDKNGDPILSGSSFRGALRAQAERIIRTMGGDCCDTESPCKPVYNRNDVDELCLACKIFGAGGWKTTLYIHDLTCEKVDRNNKRQDFVAIDRFHGGGKEGAKFDASFSERPFFKGSIELSSRMRNELEWGKGLLALVLRDLIEGDITFGFGANKGYGTLESVEITHLAQLSPQIELFRKICTERPGSYLCRDVETPGKTDAGQHQATHVDPQKKENGFHNPYHFIPLKEPDTKTWLPKELLDQDSHHSHAYYRNKTDIGAPLYNGRIICRLEAETPFFIGSENDDDQPATIENYRLNGQLAIPATSLRGMISSLAEAASNSSMRVLHNGVLSFRKKAGKALRNIGMVVIGNNEKRFILPLADSNKVFKLKGAYSRSDMIDFLDEKKSWSPVKNTVYYLEQDCSKGAVPHEQYVQGNIAGVLRILGKDEARSKDLENKKNELFIKIPPRYVDTEKNSFDYKKYISDQLEYDKLLSIPTNVWERYHDLADERTTSQKSNKDLKQDEDCQSTLWLPFHLKGAKRQRDNDKNICCLPLNHGDLVYYENQGKRVSELSFSSIWRARVEDTNNNASTTNAFFPEDLLPYSRERENISPAELLFGFVELNEEKMDDALAFAGKVRISAGIPPGNIDDTELLEPEKVVLRALSSPKPPSPALYFTQRTGDSAYISKDELSVRFYKAKGRKHYLHAMRQPQNANEVQKLDNKGIPTPSGCLPWVTADPDERPQLKVKVRPIRKKTTFWFDVNFSNLTEWELGLLCFSLRPNEYFRHKLGMGKPIGLGSVTLDIAVFQTIDRKKRYTEDEMDDERYNQDSWSNPAFKEEIERLGYSVTNVDPSFTPEQFKQIFVETMDADIYRAVDLLGNPNNICKPVHYPQVKDQELEVESYQWFVDNDKSWQEHLKPLTSCSSQLPILTRKEKIE